MNSKIYFIQGAPDTGKSTLINKLKQKFSRGYFIETDVIRSFIGQVHWNRHDHDYYYFTLEILASMINALVKTENYNPICIVDCISEDGINHIAGFLKSFVQFKQLILWVNNLELIKRVNLRQSDQFKNVDLTIQMNNFFQQKYQKSTDAKITFIDSTNLNPEKSTKIIQLLFKTKVFQFLSNEES